MNRAFSVLGVREDACKDEVKQAYEYRIKKYKSADYADDPEYARKKIAELKEAYKIAIGEAEDHVGDSIQERRELFKTRSHEDYEEKRRKVARRADEDYEEPETYKAEKRANKRAAKKAASRHYEHTAPKSPGAKKKSSASRLDLGKKINRETLGRAIDNEPGIEPLTEEMKQQKNGRILLIILALIPIVFSMFDALGSDNYYYDDDYDDDYVMNYEYITEGYDKRINNIAIEIYEVMDNADFSYEQGWKNCSDKELSQALDAFVDTYFGDNSIHNTKELMTYLDDTYHDYVYPYLDDNLDEIMYSICDFYGFPQSYQCEYMVYTNNNGERDYITSNVEYLEYLINYYRNL